MPRGTRTNKIFTDDPLLTSEDIDLYVKINQEFKVLEQKLKDLKTTNKSIYDPTSIKSYIDLLFDALRDKNNDYDKLKEDKEQIDSKISELYAENEHLQRSLRERDDRIKQLVQETDNILDNDYQIIVEKNSEIAALKAHLNNSTATPLLNESNEKDDVLNITTSQDFFIKTPVNQTKQAPQTSNRKNDHEKFFTPWKSPKNKKLKFETIEQEERKLLDNRLKNIEQNLGNILDRIKAIEKPNSISPQKSSINKETQNIKRKDGLKIEKKTEEKIDIFITGDFHARNLQTTLAKNVPRNWKIIENFNSENNFEKIAAQNGNNCSNLIIITGSNDIQKTPMKTIKQSIDTIFEKFKKSTIHFVQIPYRYDDTNLNYHIDQVNNALFQYVLKYTNVIVYKPDELTESWDYADKINLNRNGKIKLCRAISRTILEEKQNQNIENPPWPNSHKSQPSIDQPRTLKPHNHHQTKFFVPSNNKQSTPSQLLRRNQNPRPKRLSHPELNNQSYHIYHHNDNRGDHASKLPRYNNKSKYSQQNVQTFNPRSMYYEYDYHFPYLPSQANQNSRTLRNQQNTRSTQYYRTRDKNFH